VRRFRDEAGRILLDRPDAPRPAADTPAPVRFLPEYDNLLLSHADRSRVVPDERVVPLWPGNGATRGTLLVDGFWRANWGIVPERGRAHLDIEAFQPLSRRDRAAVTTEGQRLLAFAATTCEAGEIRIGVP
jgi:hypothetical protein